VDSRNHDWPAQVRELTGKRGADLIVEHVGGEILLQCFTCLARGGTVVTCGATAGRDVALKLWPLFVKEQKLVGSYGRNRKDIVATLDWAARGKLKATIWKVYPLSETREAFAALRQREVLGKVVVDTMSVK
jgi:NADPH:quinone reductase-like Zn-dependent oxidoreductase